MSRARNIKPGFFKNDLLVELPFEVRLLFIGLWTEADRAGRLEDRPLKIRMAVFPADNVDVNAGLQALHDAGFIHRYQAGETKCIQILAWDKHQNPHCKEAESVLPAPVKHGASTVQASEIPERAGLIPDSLIPDSLEEPKSADADLPPALPEADPKRRPDCPQTEIIAAYHAALPQLRRVQVWNETRRKFLSRRWAESPERQSLDWWREFFAYVAGSKFLTGQTVGRDGRAFDCDLEWLVRPGNFAKVLEGKYEDVAA
jgi:hypothetical protein